MQVELIRRWGHNHPGATVDVDDEQARWLVQNAYGTAKGQPHVSQGAAAPGTHGPDPRAGGDWSRQGAPEVQRAERRDNQAWPVPGSPVQYNAGVSTHAQQAAQQAKSKTRSNKTSKTNDTEQSTVEDTSNDEDNSSKSSRRSTSAS